MKTISVSTIMKLLYDPARILYPINSPSMAKGRDLHRELGYTNPKMFSKLIDGWVVQGMPDKLLRENNEDLIEDLKTYVAFEDRSLLLQYAHTQCNIYCYLAGVKRYKITLLNITTNQNEVVYGVLNEKQALKDIRKALKIWVKLHKILGLEVA